MTQIELAKAGITSPEMRRIARCEGVSIDFIRKGLVKGTIVIPKNIGHRLEKPCGIGKGLSTKINANIGTSKDSSGISGEIKKMELAVESGADAIMDLSTGARIEETRRKILSRSKVPVGTVPIYEIVINGLKKYGSIPNIRPEEMFAVLEKQAREGVDFFTIHAGVTKKVLNILKKIPASSI
jgi:Thiamine biosynthesis protein ThiC